MTEYIEREALEKALTVAAANDKDKNRRTWAKAICVLHDLPAVDVAPVVHGRWERRGSSWHCTRCGKGYRIICGAVAANGHKNCPNCGAKMDGGDNDDKSRDT